MEQQLPDGDQALLLVVRVAGHRLALPAQHVSEVHQLVAVSALPGAPDVVEGMIYVHGTVTPVIDLARKLTGRAQPADPAHMLVVVRTAARDLALHVDHEVELISISSDRIRGADPLDVAGASGVAVLADGLALIQDVELLLSADDGEALDEALRAAATPAELSR